MVSWSTYDGLPQLKVLVAQFFLFCLDNTSEVSSEVFVVLDLARLTTNDLLHLSLKLLNHAVLAGKFESKLPNLRRGVDKSVHISAHLLLVEHVLQVLHAFDESVHTTCRPTATVLLRPLGKLFKIAFQGHVETLQICVLDLDLVPLGEQTLPLLI